MTAFTNSHKNALLFFILSALLWSACRPSTYINREKIAGPIEKQTGYQMKRENAPGSFNLPDDTQLEDGLSEGEAIRIALWNNAKFQSALAEMNIANAGVTNARIIQNPLLRYLSPTSVVNISGYLNFAVDFIWQRPSRIRAAKFDAERVRDTLIQSGFRLIRDVQVAYADLLLAGERVTITRENAKARGELARLAGVRLKYGDISRLEASTARADSASAVDDVIAANLNYKLSVNNLNNLLGIMAVDTVFQLATFTAFDSLPVKISRAECLELAFAYRPDLRAAKTAIDAAASALGWERSKIINFTATLNFQYISSLKGGEWIPNAVNPGFQAELPIFNRNQGNIQRARAQFEKARLDYITIQQAIALQVAQAYNRYEQAYQSYLVWKNDAIPALEESVSLVQQTYQRGDISYLPVLEAMRQLQNGKQRNADAQAALRKSISELNFAIGQSAQLPANNQDHE
ncbi:MAG: TolC family protein [Luteolibacter sp.]